MNSSRSLTLRNFVRSNENCEIEQRYIEFDCKYALFSVKLLRRLTFYCSMSLFAAKQVQQRATVLKTLLRDEVFCSGVLDLVSAICLSYPYAISLPFYSLVYACFNVYHREEYASILPIASILSVNIEEMPLEELCRVFYIVIGKMHEFDVRILETLESKLFLRTDYSENPLLRHEVLVLIRNLFIKFPHEMYTVYDKNIFRMLVSYLSQPGESQQNEICSIMMQLTQQHIIDEPEFNGILSQLERRKHLHNAHLDLIEQLSLFVNVYGRVLDQIRAQSYAYGITQKHSKRLLSTLCE